MAEAGSIKCRNCDLVYRQEHDECPRCAAFVDVCCPPRIVLALLRIRDDLREATKPMKTMQAAGGDVRRAMGRTYDALESLGIGAALTAKDFRG